MARDHYQVLGLSPDASPEDIRRAYRTLSLRCHPDKNQGVPNADAAFQELSDAYRTLSSAAARAEYDRMREYVPSSPDDPFADYAYRRHFAEALAKSVREAEGQHVDPDTLFESLFGRARTQTAHVVPDAKQKHQEATATEVATACTTSTAASSTATTPSSRSCASAAGLDPGMDSATTAQADSARHDTGKDFGSQEWREKGPDREIELPLTLEELHAGCVKKRRLRKHVYDAKACGFVERTDLLTVTVQPGYRPGDRIRFHEASDEGIGTTPADVVYIITQLPHPRFTAVGSDLRLYVHVALVDALAGAVLQIETISGEVVQVRTTEVVTPGSTLRVHGKGLPRPAGPKKPVAYGDLVVIFTVEFPQLLSADDKLKIRELFHGIDTRSDPANPDNLSMRRTSSMFGGSSVTTKRTRSAHNSALGSSLTTETAILVPTVMTSVKAAQVLPHVSSSVSNAENVNPPAANRSNLNISKSKPRRRIGFFFF